MAYSLRDFGSYTVGGRMHEVTFTREASFTYDPRGHFAVEQTYVQYFIPERRLDAPPVVLVHGGGMTGSTWETTPDGRPGWLHLLLDRGYAVHVVDLPERGRAGFAAGIWDAAPILRSAEEAWGLFRFGRAEGFATRQPFEGLQFPVAAFDPFMQRIVPRWLDTTPLQTAGLAHVLRRLEAATVICHSQGAEIAFDAARAAPGTVLGIVAVEPSSQPGDGLACPLIILGGDNLDCAEHWDARGRAWAASCARITHAGGAARYLDTAAEVAPGGSHFLMMDAHMAEVLDLGLRHLARLAQ
ncbi:alpha/beta fold hydrolase [Roseovarius sp. LXJ103]|uniref:alpha/beta fold hydrolase n=1 Tax=Roseovarius carneus TaxID=2853164 RepID=UPI0011B260F2|nr:alpha/beta fold hydrolase [Roseovarius carneus]MBZ8118833.1 alpha/beta fold hydrolase [Roseovarius carneus]